MINIQENWLTYYESASGCGYSSAEGFQTSWSLFRLDNFSDPLLVFSVSISDRAVINGFSQVMFDIVHVNIGGVWDSNRHQLTVPISGIHFLSL